MRRIFMALAMLGLIGAAGFSMHYRKQTIQDPPISMLPGPMTGEMARVRTIDPPPAPADQATREIDVPARSVAVPANGAGRSTIDTGPSPVSNGATSPVPTEDSLIIDGEPVVELDIHASGLTVAHGIAGVPLPPERLDLYGFPGISRDAAKAWLTAYLGKGSALGNWPQGTDPRTKAQSLKAVQSAFLGAYPFLRDLPRLLGVPGSPKRSCFIIASMT